VKFAQAFVVVCLAFGVLAGTAAADRRDAWTGPVTGTFVTNNSDLSCALLPGGFQRSVRYRGTVDTSGSAADLAVGACLTDLALGGEFFAGSFSLRGEHGIFHGYAAGFEAFTGINYFQIAFRNSAPSPVRLIFQGCETGGALLAATIGQADAPEDRSCTGV
jgi:hypothetical protein